jgi:NAD(P)-dependent dehydrogenase (short-subunit alcohol dehydrogenase family)
MASLLCGRACHCQPSRARLKGRASHQDWKARMATTGHNRLVTVIGGSGFVGRQVVRGLAREGYRVRVACRRPNLALAALPNGTPGQIVPVQANVRYPASLAAACEGAYAVVNLVGVLTSSGAQSFDAIHAFGAEAAAHAAHAARLRVRRVRHESFLARKLSGRPSYLDRKMVSSTSSRRWRDLRRPCR